MKPLLIVDGKTLSERLMEHEERRRLEPLEATLTVPTLPADYVPPVVAQPPHHCHWPGCKVTVPPKLWGCRDHWKRLPKVFQDAIWRAYRPGQEVTKTPSPAYLQTVRVVEAWIEATTTPVLKRPDGSLRTLNLAEREELTRHMAAELPLQSRPDHALLALARALRVR